MAYPTIIRRDTHREEDSYDIDVPISGFSTGDLCVVGWQMGNTGKAIATDGGFTWTRSTGSDSFNIGFRTLQAGDGTVRTIGTSVFSVRHCIVSWVLRGWTAYDLSSFAGEFEEVNEEEYSSDPPELDPSFDRSETLWLAINGNKSQGDTLDSTPSGFSNVQNDYLTVSVGCISCEKLSKDVTIDPGKFWISESASNPSMQSVTVGVAGDPVGVGGGFGGFG